MFYRQLRDYLQSPRGIIVDPLWRDCNPPEDPNWPTPDTQQEVEQLMNRLPHWAQVVCAITAAEMVLWRWEEWAEEAQNLIIEHRESPRQAIRAARQWLEEQTPETQETALDAAEDAEDVAEAAAGVARAAAAAAWAPWAAPRAAAAWAAEAAAEAATWAAEAAARAGWAAGAVARAVWAAKATAGAAGAAARAEFFNNWWRLCRCRLAFILEARL